MSRKIDEGICVYGASVISKHLQALQAEIDGVRLAEDIEYIHRMRVATRRLRSALPLFSDCFPQKRMESWTGQVKAITQALGDARDTDVQLEALKIAEADLADPGCKPGLKRLELRLRQKRSRLQIKVMHALDEFVASGVIEAMQERLAPLLARQDDTYLYNPSLYQRGFQAINTDLRALLAYEPYINQPEYVTELHEMRIAAKHLRYTMEAFTPLYPGELKTPLQVTRKVQEQLGDLHDYDVWGMYLPVFLEKEQALIFKFYGSLRGYARIQVGIDALMERQQGKRHEVYTEFVSYWDRITADATWKSLQTTIQAPYYRVEPVQNNTLVPGTDQ